MLDILPGLEGVASSSRGDDKQPPLKIKRRRGQYVGAAICYGWHILRRRVKCTWRNFLLTVSNDAWFGTTAGPLQHLQMVQIMEAWRRGDGFACNQTTE